MKKKPTQVRVEPVTYPNGRIYYSVWLGSRRLANVDKVDEGQWVPFGMLRPSATIEDAVARCIARAVLVAVTDAKELLAASELPVSVGAVDPQGEKVTE